MRFGDELLNRTLFIQKLVKYSISGTKVRMNVSTNHEYLYIEPDDDGRHPLMHLCIGSYGYGHLTSIDHKYMNSCVKILLNIDKIDCNILDNNDKGTILHKVCDN